MKRHCGQATRICFVLVTLLAAAIPRIHAADAGEVTKAERAALRAIPQVTIANRRYYLFGGDIPMTANEVIGSLRQQQMLQRQSETIDPCDGAIASDNTPTPLLGPCLEQRDYIVRNGVKHYKFWLREKEIATLAAQRKSVVEQSREPQAGRPSPSDLVTRDLPIRQFEVQRYGVLVACMDFKSYCADLDAVLEVTMLSGGGLGPRATVDVVQRRRNFWAREYRRIRFAIVRKAFPRGAYETTKAALLAATKRWMEVCPACEVVFEYAAEHDGLQSYAQFRDLARADTLRFAVQYAPGDGDAVASAFFPDAPINRRFLTVHSRFFSADRTDAGRVGVMLHELGHILGYRHEQIRKFGPGQKKFGLCTEEMRMKENEDWQGISTYDPISIMHYVCRKNELARIDLSETDIVDHRILYSVIGR